MTSLRSCEWAQPRHQLVHIAHSASLALRSADAARLLRPGGTLAIFIGGGLPLILDRDSEGKAKISDVGQCLIDFMNNSVMAEFNKVSAREIS